MPERNAIRMLADAGEQTRGVGREALARNQHHGSGIDQADRLQFAGEIVGEVLVQQRPGRQCEIVDEGRVAVRLRADQPGGAQSSACPGTFSSTTCCPSVSLMA